MRNKVLATNTFLIDDSSSPAPFEMQTYETRLKAEFVTQGIQLFASRERIIVLDTQVASLS